MNCCKSIDIACKLGHLDCVKIYIENADFYQKLYCMQTAIEYNHLNIIEYLHQICETSLNPLHFRISVQCNRLNITEYYIKNKNYIKFSDFDVVIVSIKNNNLSMLKLLINNDFKFNNLAPLIYASKYDNLEMTSYLISVGCKVCQKSIINAVRYNNYNCLKYLMKKLDTNKLDINTYYDSETAFNTALNFGSIKCLSILKKYFKIDRRKLYITNKKCKQSFLKLVF